jgi:hypothetical protein
MLKINEYSLNDSGTVAEMKSRFAHFYHVPVVLIGGLYLLSAGLVAARAPLWHDEIVTYYVSKLGGPGAIIQALLAKVDNQPPVDYLVRHFFLSTFGDSALAFRMPSILAFLVAAVCLYIIVLRRASPLAAIVAFTLPFGTAVLHYAVEGRSYSLLIASIALSFLAWQLATEKPRPLRLALLTFSLALGPFVHFYGVFNFLPIAVGEAWRSWERRKICWPIVFSGVVAFLLLGLLVPLALNASQFAAHFWSALSPTAPFNSYFWLVGAAMPAFMACLILYSTATLVLPNGAPSGTDARPVPLHEIAAALVAALLPFTTYILAVLMTHAYAVRYVLNTIVGIALLLAFLTYRVERLRRLYGLIIAVCFAFWAAGFLIHDAGKIQSKPFALLDNYLESIETATLPVVVPNFNQFLLMYYYLPEGLKDRIYYPLNDGRDRQISDSDTIGREFLNLKPFVPINVPKFCTFAKQHPSFLVVTGGDGWLYRKLWKDGATINIVSGRYPDNAVLSVTLNRLSGC